MPKQMSLEEAIEYLKFKTQCRMFNKKVAKTLITHAQHPTCSWCGSNDLVCGKAWKEEREKLLKQIETLKAQGKK